VASAPADAPALTEPEAPEAPLVEPTALPAPPLRDPAVFTRPGASGMSPRALFDAIYDLAGQALTQAQADLRYVERTGDTMVGLLTLNPGTGAALTATGALVPTTTAAYDLGTAATRWLTVYAQDLNLTMATATTATAGGAPALPATPTGYITVTIAGTARKIPYYNT
jgi:hypothetical protein